MYDIVIIGAGVSAVFFAHEYLHRKAEAKVLLLEKGQPFQKRVCPLLSEMTETCRHCSVCHRMSGFGGLGKSEGKFNYTSDFGGELEQKIGLEQAKQAMKRVDEIICEFGGSVVATYDTKQADLAASLPKHYSLLSAKVRHLGNAVSNQLFQQLAFELSTKIEIRYQEEIISLEKKGRQFQVQLQNETIESKKVILATGQSGGDSLMEICKRLGIHPRRSRLDLGIRVEMANAYLAKTLSEQFETKIHYQNKEMVATTYCMNPRGRVVKKHQNGLVMADGQNYLQAIATNQLNFTVLVPFYFSTFQAAKQYAKQVISSINQERERIICQRYDDFLHRIPTEQQRLNSGSIQPTIACEGGNLWDEVPKASLIGLRKILAAIHFLEGKEVPTDTLLYGLDAKFYQPEIPSGSDFQTEVRGLYVVGDCSGVTHSLAQAAASGVYLANLFSK